MKIKVKAMCACGDEVTEKDMEVSNFYPLVKILSEAGDIRSDPVAKYICVDKILDLFKESRPPESERWKPKKGDEVTEKDIETKITTLFVYRTISRIHYQCRECHAVVDYQTDSLPTKNECHQCLQPLD